MPLINLIIPLVVVGVMLWRRLRQMRILPSWHVFPLHDWRLDTRERD
jgi:hypothetical protein